MTPRSSRPAISGKTAEPATPPAQIFHDLPKRTPFLVDGRDEAERMERPAMESRPPPHADPFSLPGGADRAAGDAGAEMRRTSRPLRVVESPPSEAEPEFEPAEPTVPTGAPVAEATQQTERESSNTPWIAAAMILLLLGGIGGFWLLSGRDGRSAAPAARKEPVAGQTSPAPAVAGPVAPKPAAVVAEPVGALEVMVASVPEGAKAELVGGTQSGVTPMTFRGLIAGQSYQVKITKDGFLAAEIHMMPEAGNPPPVELEVKPNVLHVTSEPTGAQVWIDGRRQRSLTPVVVELTRRMSDRKQVTVSLRMRGYTSAEQRVELDGLVDQGDSMVQEVAMVLARRPIVRPTATDEEGSGSEGNGSTSTEESEAESGDTAATDGATRADAAGKSTSDEPADQTTGESRKGKSPRSGAVDRGDPIPDWMKPE